MRTFSYTITDELGIHARPAGLLVKKVSGFKSKVELVAPKGKADAKRLMAVMKLSVKTGETVTINVEGEDEDIAADEIEQFFKENL